jgi:hypothetical protein
MGLINSLHWVIPNPTLAYSTVLPKGVVREDEPTLTTIDQRDDDEKRVVGRFVAIRGYESVSACIGSGMIVEAQYRAISSRKDDALTRLSEVGE